VLEIFKKIRSVCQGNNDLSDQSKIPGTGKYLFVEILSFLPDELQPDELQPGHSQSASVIINVFLMMRQSYEKD